MLLAVYEDGKMFDRAQKLLDDWILSTGEDSRLAALRIRKIVMYAKAEQFDQAEKYALGWIEQSPRALQPRQALFGVLLEAEQYERAEKHVKAWLKEAEASVVPTSQPAEGKGRSFLRFCRQLLVRLMVAQQHYAEALKRTEEFLKGEPKDTTFLMLQSTCLTELGRDREAIAPLETALKIEPDDATHNNNLGYLYADMGIHLAKAERMIRKALDAARKADASDRHIMDSLGWVLYKQGRVKEAARVFDTLLRDDPSSPYDKGVILDHAGDVYCRLGQTDKAVELWRKALEKARQAKRPDAEVRKVLALAGKKIQAVQAGAATPVAPFGEGVDDKLKPGEKKPASQPAAPAAESRPAAPDVK
jgi:Tfp pilus assembly protein PilF